MTSNVARYVADRHQFRLNELTTADGRPLHQAIEAWQEQHIFTPLDEEEGNNWKFPFVYLELPRGHGKTLVLAAEAITVAMLEPDTAVYMTAADRDQAALMMEQVSGFVRRNPLLQRAVTLSKFEARISNGSIIRVLAADANSSWGLGGTSTGVLILIDELTQWVSEAAETFYESMVSATGKTKRWRILIAGNAGWNKESLAWRARELAQTSEWGFLYAPIGQQASWITKDWIDVQRQLLPEDSYLRLIENIWTQGSGSLFTGEMVQNIVDPKLSPRVEGEAGVPYVIGVDIGLKHDRSVISVLHRDNRRVVLDFMRVWQGTSDNPVSLEEVERELISLSQRFSVRDVFCDPWQFAASIERLKTHMRIREWQFSSSSVQRLSEGLFEAVTSRKLAIYPDAALEAELLGLQSVNTSYGWRLDHSKKGFSDRVMSMGMCVVELLAKEPKTFNQIIRIATPADMAAHRRTKAKRAALKQARLVELREKAREDILALEQERLANTPRAEIEVRCMLPKLEFRIGNTTHQMLIGDRMWIPKSLADDLVEKHGHLVAHTNSRTVRGNEIIEQGVTL